jgi:hypothetical protein
MHSLKHALYTLLAMLALSATATATATAAIPDMPELLQVKEKSKIEWSSGKLKLTTLTKLLLDCAKSKGTGEIETRLTGTLDIDFEECKESALNTGCLSEGMTEKLILAKVAWRLVWDTKPAEGKELGAGILLLLSGEVKIKCPTVKQTLVILNDGEILGLVKPTNKLVKVLELELKQENGENLEKTYWELEAGVFLEKKIKPLMILINAEPTEVSSSEEIVGITVAAKEQEVLLDA